MLLFNIATVLGPRWIAAAGHNGPSSISLWVIAAIFFFVPGALVINELSSRFPEEGGLYSWSKQAFGDFHGFVAGWTYWIYTVFYFPGLLLASASMAGYIMGTRGAALAQDRTFLLTVSLGLLLVAVVLNIIGLNIGKWLQNAGGVGTYVPLLILAVVAAIVVSRHGSATHFTVRSMMPTVNFGTISFWSNIAFAFTGLELVSAMSEEVRDPRRTLPRAVFGAGALIALMYIAGTFAVLGLMPAQNVDPQERSVQRNHCRLSRPRHRLSRHDGRGSGHRRQCRWSGQHCCWYCTGAVRRRHRSLSSRGIRQDSSQVEDALHLHPRPGHPFRNHSRSQPDHESKSVITGYQLVVNAAIILYFIPFLYMFAAVIKLSGRKDRSENPHAVLVPGGKLGVWVCGSLGFLVVLLGIVLSFFPPCRNRGGRTLGAPVDSRHCRIGPDWPDPLLARRSLQEAGSMKRFARIGAQPSGLNYHPRCYSLQVCVTQE